MTAGDVDAVLAGYADDALLIHPDGMVHGTAALRDFYVQTIGAATGLAPTWNVQAARETIFAVWTLDGATGCETLLVREGRVAVHTGFSTR